MQIKCCPPELIKLGNIEVIYFYKAVAKSSRYTYDDLIK